MPWAIIGAMIAYRKSWFDEIGATKFPETWEEYREVGKKLKAKGRPIGQTLGHTFGDAPTFAYPYLWSWGGKEVEADGKTVAINTKETMESVKFMTALLEGCPRRGRACLGRHQQQPRLPVADHLRHAQRRLDLHRVAAQARQVHDGKGRAAEDRHPAFTTAQGAGRPVRDASLPLACVTSYSKNQKAAKDFLKWIHSRPVYEKWFISQKGFATPSHARVGEAQDVGRGPGDGALPGRGHARPRPGYAGPSGEKAAEVLSKYIIVDMYAKAVQGMPAEDAVKWADGELKKVYG